MNKWLGYTYTVTSALASTLGSLVIISIENKYTALPFALLILIALVAYSPCNFFSALAFYKLAPEVVIFLFTVFVTITDILFGIFFQQNQVQNYPLFFAAILLVFWAITHTKERETQPVEDVISKNEKLLYLFSLLIIISGTITRGWLLNVIVFAVAQYTATIIILRLTKFAELKLKKTGPFVDYIVASIGFAPTVISGVIVVTTVENLAVGGIALTVASLAFPYIGAKVFFGRSVALKEWFNIILATIGTVMITQSF